MEQVEAMLDGTIFDLLSQYVNVSRTTDCRKFITVGREQLIDYLLRNPSAAETYFQKQAKINATHDVERIFREGAGYVIVTMDHGQRRFPRRFNTLEDAVAHLVLVNHGLF